MKLSLETRYNVLDEVEYKMLDISAKVENGEPLVKIEKDVISFVDIQAHRDGRIYVAYGMENGDIICSDAIIKCLNE